MTYTLHRLAPGSYDLALDGQIVGSLVRNITAGGGVSGWQAELLNAVPADQRPPPFESVTHPFKSLEAAIAWLGGATVSEAVDNG
ncbi:MAG: hypothetical protein EON55_01485 [Alphaproteobacteria bacterium]|nr:MAG: hypothetical protein EON55_01485 [Alphaproteobacteria bacterium]